MADILFKCSGCSAPLAADADCIGQVIECPGCSQKVLVPDAGVAFRCGKCQAGLGAPAGMVGSSCDCPTCGTRLTIPQPSGKPIPFKAKPLAPVAAPPQPPRGRRCPYCGGGIAPAAIICVNCGTNLVTGQKYGQSRLSSSGGPLGGRRNSRSDGAGSEWGMGGVKFVASILVTMILLRMLWSFVRGLPSIYGEGSEGGNAKAQSGRSQAPVSGRVEQQAEADQRRRVEQMRVEQQRAEQRRIEQVRDEQQRATQAQDAANRAAEAKRLDDAAAQERAITRAAYEARRRLEKAKNAMDELVKKCSQLTDDLAKEYVQFVCNDSPYGGYRIIRVEPDGISVRWPSGVAKIAFTELPAEYQKKYAYSPEVIAEYQDALCCAEVTRAQSAADQPNNSEEQDPQSNALLKQGLASQQRGDSVQAVVYFRLAADRGSAWGQNNLGCSYMQGDGVQKDAEMGARWIRKAADQGLRDAQGAMGSCYTQGWGVEKDAVEGARWYRKAAEQGDAVSQRQLSLMYAVGIGVPKSNEEAVRWAREAASRGDQQAREWIAKWDAAQGQRPVQVGVGGSSSSSGGQTPSMGHKNPWGKAGGRVVGTYASYAAADRAKQGMRGLVNGTLEAMEEQVANAGNASMTVQRPPEYSIELDSERGVWLLIEQRF